MNKSLKKLTGKHLHVSHSKSFRKKTEYFYMAVDSNKMPNNDFK